MDTVHPAHEIHGVGLITPQEQDEKNLHFVLFSESQLDRALQKHNLQTIPAFCLMEHHEREGSVRKRALQLSAQI